MSAIRSKLNNSKNVVILSIDYDSCGEILFDSDASYAHIRNKFLCRLHTDIGQQKPMVEVYCGSLRQDLRTDISLNLRNKNGLCFRNYTQFCAGHGWTFRPLLYADVVNKKPSGTAIHNETLVCKPPTNKVEIIQAQIDEAEKNHSGKNIKFVFYDDDFDGIILPALASKLKTGPYTTLLLVKQDSNIDICQNYHTSSATNSIASASEKKATTADDEDEDDLLEGYQIVRDNTSTLIQESKEQAKTTYTENQVSFTFFSNGEKTKTAKLVYDKDIVENFFSY